MANPEPTEPFDVAPGLHVIPLRTPTLPPATRINCVVVGGPAEVLVIDPGSPWPDVQAELVEHLGNRRVVRILATHHHNDHVGGLLALKESTGAPTAAHALTQERVAGIDDILEDGDEIPVPGFPGRTLKALFTPGHAPGHLCYQDSETGVVIAGDMVAGTGTIVVAPPEGHMGTYLASLQRLRKVGATTLVPAHGPVLEDAVETIDSYTRHRLWREARVYGALAEEPRDLSAVTKLAYTDVPESLHPLAAYSARAHLDHLVEQGRAATCDGPAWTTA